MQSTLGPERGPDDLTMAAAALSASQSTDKAQENLAKQIDNQTDMQTELTDGREARSDINAKQASLTKRASEMRKVPKDLKTERPVTLRPIGKIKSSADGFNKNNPSLKQNALIGLRDLTKGKTKEEILTIVKSFYNDATDVHQALSFLIENVDEGDSKTRTELEQAQEEFKNQYSREIQAGINIMSVATKASNKGLGTPENLKDLYRGVTGTHRETGEVWKELKQKCNNNYEELELVLRFLLKSLSADLGAGSDLGKKSSSIEPAKLHTLITEIKTMQAILQTHRLFKRMEPRMIKQIEALQNPHYASAA